MPRDGKNKWISRRLTAVQRNTTSEANFISVQPPIERIVLKAGTANTVSLPMDLVIIGNRDEGIFPGYQQVQDIFRS